MRKLSLILTLCLMDTAVACAQSSTSDSAPSWQRLQGLAPGIGIHASAHKASSASCYFKSASETEMLCVTGSGSQLMFQRADLKSVKIRHRRRSTLAGLAIGAGAGALIGAPLGRSNDFIGHGAAAVIIGVPGAIIGTIVGATTDFTHSTVYKAR